MSPQTSITIDHSPDLDDARDRFLDDIGDWINTCCAEYAPIPPSDVHDQATYTTSWLPYMALTGDREPLKFMTDLRDQIWHHFTDSGQWTNGYWKSGEVHHATEHFELFLASLYQALPDDGDTIAQFIDAVEHVGNWDESVEPWFDWDTGLFRSMYLGTEDVRLASGLETNLPDHFRCANLALWAYQMTREQKYLALPTKNIGLWADAINAGQTLPIALSVDGPIYSLADDAEQAYRGFAGQAPDLNDEVDRAENFLASNGVGTFLQLWQLTGEVRFLTAAQCIIDVLATQLLDPTAGPAADMIRTYRRTMHGTGHEKRYDEFINSAVDELDLSPIQTLSIDPAPARKSRPSGIGKRQDMPNWFEDGEPRTRNPILLAVAAEIQNDEPLAIQSLDLARHYFLLARRVYPNGRHHGCSARTVSAVARGHGRANNAGLVTAVFGKLTAIEDQI